MNFRFQFGQRVLLIESGRTGRVIGQGFSVDGDISFSFYSVEWDDNGRTMNISEQDLVAAPVPLFPESRTRTADRRRRRAVRLAAGSDGRSRIPTMIEPSRLIIWAECTYLGHHTVTAQ
jgi:hypothetical protein